MAVVDYIINGKNNLSKVLENIRKDADNTDKSVSSIGKNGVGGGGGGGMLGSIVGGNLLAGGISSAASALKDFGISSVQAFSKYEQFGVALTTMFHGNKQEAKGLSDELVDIAKKTPFELSELQDATKQLIAYGSQSHQVGKELTMLGDISAGVGAPIGEIAYLYGTARTQGRLFARDIYQLSGRGIPIVEALAKQFGVTKDKVMDLVSAGKVGFPEMQKALQGMTAEGGQFFHMMEAQSATLGGKFSNLTDSWEQFKISLAESKQGVLHEILDWSTEFVGNLQYAAKITNQLTSARQASGTNNENWFQRNFSFGRNTTKNMENMQMNVSGTEDFIQESLKNGNTKRALQQSGLLDTQLEKDKRLLGVKGYEGYGNLHEGATDKRGFNKEEIRAELAMLVESQRNVTQMFKSANDSRNYKGDKGGKGDKFGKDDTTGTGTTIESGTPKNLIINVYGGVGTNTTIENKNNLKLSTEEVGMKWLELINDAYTGMV